MKKLQMPLKVSIDPVDMYWLASAAGSDLSSNADAYRDFVLSRLMSRIIFYKTTCKTWRQYSNALTLLIHVHVKDASFFRDIVKRGLVRPIDIHRVKSLRNCDKLAKIQFNDRILLSYSMDNAQFLTQWS